MPTYEFLCKKRNKVFDLTSSISESERKKKGGIWIDKHQVGQTPREHDLNIFQGIPGLLDWFMKESKF